MPMFWPQEIVTFSWLGPVLRSISWPLKLFVYIFSQFIPKLYTKWQQKVVVGRTLTKHGRTIPKSKLNTKLSVRHHTKKQLFFKKYENFKKIFFFAKKKTISLVFPNKEISLRPELSSPAHFRIQGGGGVLSLMYEWTNGQRKSLCQI